MGEFFKPWRRRVGVVTLVMACVTTVGWVRSLAIHDVIYRYSGVPCFAEVESMHGYILWWSSSKSFFPENSSGLSWSDVPIRMNGFNLNGYGIKTPWLIKQIGFGIGTLQENNGKDRDVWIFPYWSITIPLTFISFWLLLWKPRKSNPKKFAEPTPERVA